MWPKRAKNKCGDISYNVFNRREWSYFILKPLDFTVFCRNDHLTESKHQKPIFFGLLSQYLQKIRLSSFGATE